MKSSSQKSSSSLLTVANVADQLQVSNRTVRRLIASKKIKALRIGRAIRITPAALDGYMSAAASE